MDISGSVCELGNGVSVVNATDALISFQLGGEIVEVPPCGVVLRTDVWKDVVFSGESHSVIGMVSGPAGDGRKAFQILDEVIPEGCLILATGEATKIYPLPVVAPVLSVKDGLMDPAKFIRLEVRKLL